MGEAVGRTIITAGPDIGPQHGSRASGALCISAAGGKEVCTPAELLPHAARRDGSFFRAGVALLTFDVYDGLPVQRLPLQRAGQDVDAEAEDGEEAGGMYAAAVVDLHY